jgi:hypothetical protein
MRKLLTFLIALASIVFAVVASPVQAQMGQIPNIAQLQPAPSGGGYTGPGDLTLSGTFQQWGGFRAYSAATAGTKAVQLTRASDSTTQDINSLPIQRSFLARAATYTAVRSSPIASAIIWSKSPSASPTASNANRISL